MRVNMRTKRKIAGQPGKRAVDPAQPAWWTRSRGFTIVETLVSLALMALAVLLVSNIIVAALDSYKKSSIRLQAEREIESRKNRLLSAPFAAAELQEGNDSKDGRIFTLYWDITDLTPTLKIIHISLTYKYTYHQVTQKTYFYKSKYINTSKIPANPQPDR